MIEDDIAPAEDGGSARDKARERSLRFLDFLDAYYATFFPPVRTLQGYNDLIVRRGAVPDVEGVQVRPGGDTWLACELLALPPPPEVPEDLLPWLVAPPTASAPPQLQHPDAQARALLALGAGPPLSGGVAVDLDDLDEAQLAAHGVTGVLPGGVGEALRVVTEEVDAARDRLEVWAASVWAPWAQRWLEIDKGRSFYKQLFDLRARVERDRETVECLWGLGRLRWAVEQEDGEAAEVDHPLLTVAVELTADSRTGRISVCPAGAPVVETGWSTGLPLADRAGFNDDRSYVQQVELDVWGDSATGLLTGLLRHIDLDGVADEDRASQGGVATLATGDWALFVRRRQPNFRGFIEDQRRLYREEGAEVPAPFAALVVDEASSLGAAPDGALPGLGPMGMPTPPEQAERVLLPLPANEEQMRIVAMARSRAGVTAQGPPGTGKSHTIANLICHYIAHGRRVLVTAQKEQALKVLIDKVPEELRQLCVPVLGADAAARERLRGTVTAIANAVHRAPDQGTIASLTQQLDDIEARFAQTTTALKARRAAEAAPAPGRPAGHDQAHWTPSTVASWVASHTGLSGVPDAPGTAEPPPLSGEELQELYDLCERLGTEDPTRALERLPDPDALPTGSALADRHAEVARLRDALADNEAHVASWDSVDLAGAQQLGALAADLQGWGEWLTALAGSWVAAVLAAAREPRLAAVWRDFCEGAASDVEAVLATTRALAADMVVIGGPGEGGEPGPEFVAALSEARERINAGKGVGPFQRSARKALDACQVNGRTPTSAADMDLVFAEVARRSAQRRLTTRWTNIAARTAVPALSGTRPVEEELAGHVAAVRAALDWPAKVWPALADRLRRAGLVVPEASAAVDLINLAKVCRSLTHRARLTELEQADAELARNLREGQHAEDASVLWSSLSTALASLSYSTWDGLVAETVRLRGLRQQAARRRDLLEALHAKAPMMAAQVARGSQPVAGSDFGAAWTWRALDAWLSRLAEGPEPATLQAELESLARQRRRVTTDLVAAKAWSALAHSVDDRRRTALNWFTTANAKLGKGTGRYAPRWESEVRAAMNEAKDAVPVWIMPINRVIADFRPSADPPFDVIIVDEASQVGMLGTPVLALAKRAIVVGDDKQTSPDNVGVLRQGVFDLLDEHLAMVRDRRTRFDPDNSLYDISRQRFPQVVQLREHFRCLPRIIEFSNRHWYDGSIVPLRDRPPRPGWAPLGSVFVPAGVRQRSNDTNQAEAEAVVDLIGELVKDPDYAEMSFGVVTLLGSGQAQLVNSLLLDHLGPVVMEERNLRVGDPAAFQGDERDVVVLSLVVAHDPDSRIGAMNTPAAARRVNVAASRACNQLWVVHSVEPDAFHPDDPRRALLEHCLVPVDEAQVALNLERAESQFERDVLTRIVAAGYTRVQTQYQVGGYRIDIVVEGPESRLAVECDGDYWHGPEAWDHDRARQMVLERAGWTFERIRGSSFYLDPAKALEPLWARLDRIGVPKGDWAGDARPRPARRTWPDDFPERVTLLPAEGDFAEASDGGPGVGHEGWAGRSGEPDGPGPLSGAVPAPGTQSNGVSELSGGWRGVSPTTPIGGPPRARSHWREAPSIGEVREWAREQGMRVGERGRLGPDVLEAWNKAHPERPVQRSGHGRPVAPALSRGDVPSMTEIRLWAMRIGFDVGQRGQLAAEVLAAWNMAHPGRAVET